MPIFVMIISWLFPIAILLYLILITSFVSKFRRNEPVRWAAIGSPNSYDPNGQIKILGLVFLPNRIQGELWNKYGSWIMAIRISAAISFLSMIAVFLMMTYGMYPSK